jgi:formylglycine-generating enzyme required for sulfatase activity
MSGARARVRSSSVAAPVATALAFAPVAAIAALGCGGTSAPAPGQVMLVLETDGGVGTTLDFERVAVVVTDERASGQIIKTYEVTPARLPGTVALVADRAGAAATKVEVFATDARGALRVYQTARVTLPSEGARMLRVKLEAACDGVFPKVACPGGLASCAAAPKVACTEGQSCLAGRCVPVQEFDARELPAFEASRVEACEPETEAAICARRGIACGSFVFADTCGTPRVVRCGACEGEASGTTAKLAGPGLDDCGPLGADLCGRSLLVPGGAFSRRGDALTPGSVSPVRLDKYEVTVGRFRKFVDAWLGGWRPDARSGKHAHLNGGAGLAAIGGGFESGWDPAWTAYVGAPAAVGGVPTGRGATTKEEFDANLPGQGNAPMWTSAPAGNERRPMNSLSWYDLYAFCVWDGGFLPSMNERTFAAMGGSEGRIYPWGARNPSGDPSLAIHDCLWWNPAAGPNECTPGDVAPVGSAPAGDARWGQSDLVGSVFEWALDAYGTPPIDGCLDCARLERANTRAQCGGGFGSPSSFLDTRDCSAQGKAARDTVTGGRCARRP